MVIQIDGVPPSTEIRARLRAEDRPVILAFSTGKDSITAWLALRDAGIPVRPYYMYGIPGNLRFIEDTLAYFEDYFGTRIPRFPHPSLYRQLNMLVWQTPERCAVIEAAKLPEPDYAEYGDLLREEFGLDPSTWIADGVRAADSITRRVSVKKHGVMKPSNKKVSPVWDWQIADVRAAIADHGVQLPVDYEMFGRSFDGIDYRFLKPVHDRFPDDYQRILDWFPLAELELIRHDL